MPPMVGAPIVVLALSSVATSWVTLDRSESCFVQHLLPEVWLSYEFASLRHVAAFCHCTMVDVVALAEFVSASLRVFA